MSPPIGFFGGAFNPPHLGHLAVAVRFRSQFPDLPLCLVPNGMPNHRQLHQNPGSPHRLAMTQLLVGDLPGVSVLDVEITRPGPHTTYGTLSFLREQKLGEQFILLVGDDWVEKLPTWHRFSELCRWVSWAIFPRRGFSNAQRVETQHLLDKASVNSGVVPRLFWLEMDKVMASSTEIRAELKQNPLSNHPMLPPSVRRYIQENGLYQ